MLKNAAAAIRMTKEVNAIVKEEVKNYSETELNEIYGDSNKLKTFAKTIYPKFSEELRAVITLDAFQNSLIKQKKNIDKKPSLVDKFKKKMNIP